MAVSRYKTSSIRRNKYNAKKTIVDGHKFDSVKESKRYIQLLILQKAGEISDLELQPRIPLIVNEQKIGYYVGDFRYVTKGGISVLEDVKSPATMTSVYRLKKKILEAQTPPIIITEVMST